MVKIKNEQLKEGMMLAGDVKDRSGRILLREGVTLTAKAITTLKAWGVVAVDVQSDSSDEDAATLDEIECLKKDAVFQQTVEEDVNRQFAAQDTGQPIIQELYQVIYDYNLHKAAEKAIRGRHGDENNT